MDGAPFGAPSPRPSGRGLPHNSGAHPHLLISIVAQYLKEPGISHAVPG